MATQTELQTIGQALLVHGTVRAESSNGISQVIRPNSPIHLDDRIDTGPDGGLTIAFAKPGTAQLELGRMTDMVIDNDVLGAEGTALTDLAVEAPLIADLLQNWEGFEPVIPIESVDYGVPADSDETAAADAGAIPGLDGGAADDLAAAEPEDGGIDPMEDHLANLIPPPEDGS